MSDQTTGTTKPPPGSACPVCGSTEHPAGYHENRPETADREPGTEN